MKFLALITMTLLTVAAQAQSSSTISTSSPANTSTTTISPTKSASSNLILGFKSTNDSVRSANSDVIGSRTAKSKNEAYLGYRLDSGWGAFFNAVQSYNVYYRENTQINAKTKTKANGWSLGDPSITILHPDYYKSSNLNLFGQFRYYIPTTQNSVDKNVNLFSYYFRLNAKFEGGHEIFNELIPRYFSNSTYLPTDTTNYVEDTTIYSYKLDGTGWKIGGRSWAQYEEHKKTGTGYCLEAGPQATYTFSSNLNVSPSIMLPLLKNNKVYEGPEAVAMDQAYLSILVQARL